MRVVIGDFVRRLRRYGGIKRNRYKVVIVGNCQARPLARILTILNPDIEVTAIAIVNLLKSDQADKYISFFEEADFIVSQLIDYNYPCDFVRTNVLKNAFGYKLTTIVNLYYSGYNPDLIYIRNASSGTLKSPLWEYHSTTFLNSWKEGLSVGETVSRYFDIEYNETKYSEVLSSSMEELRRREFFADIQITDIIEEGLHKEKLFFSFNHPCNSLMIKMCVRVLNKMGVETRNSIDSFSTKEPLDKVIVPVNVYSKISLNVEFDDIDYFKGVHCTIFPGGKVMLSKKRHYSVSEIVEKYFKIYDVNLTNEM